MIPPDELKQYINIVPNWYGILSYTIFHKFADYITNYKYNPERKYKN